MKGEKGRRTMSSTTRWRTTVTETILRRLPPITVAVRALRPAASGTTVSWGNTASFELMKTSARPGTLPSLALAVERGWRG